MHEMIIYKSSRKETDTFQLLNKLKYFVIQKRNKDIVIKTSPH